MLNHVMVGSQDIERAKRFYDAVLGVLGAPEGMRNTGPGGHQRVFWRHDGNTFGITEPINGEAPSVSNGATIGFKCTSPEQLQQFHDVAVAHGGTAIEDAPGPRGDGTMHLAYVRDPDGHKLCGLYRASRKA